MYKICCLFFFYDSCVVIRVISFVQWRIGYWVRPFNICFLFWVDELAVSSHGLRTVTRSAVLHAVSLRVRQRCFFFSSGTADSFDTVRFRFRNNIVPLNLWNVVHFRIGKNIHCESKKQDTKLLPITSPNINRFSKFFLCWTQ